MTNDTITEDLRAATVDARTEDGSPASIRAAMARIDAALVTFGDDLKIAEMVRATCLKKGDDAEVDRIEATIAGLRRGIERLGIMRESHEASIPFAEHREKMQHLQSLYDRRESIAVRLKARWEATYLPAATALSELIELQQQLTEAAYAFTSIRARMQTSGIDVSSVRSDWTAVDGLGFDLARPFHLPGVWPRPVPARVYTPEELAPRPTGPARMTGSTVRQPGTPAPGWPGAFYEKEGVADVAPPSGPVPPALASDVRKPGTTAPDGSAEPASEVRRLGTPAPAGSGGNPRLTLVSDR